MADQLKLKDEGAGGVAVYLIGFHDLNQASTTMLRVAKAAIREQQ
jgi:hypothetical protein